MGGRTEEVKGIFEEYAKKYIEILNEYAAKRAQLWDEIEDDDALEDALYELEEEGNREVGKLQEEVEKKLKGLGNIEVEWDAGGDGWCYFNAPGYSYYVCIDYFRVIDKDAKKIHLVAIQHLELNRPKETEYKLEDVVVETRELVDEEETPFTATLIENLSEYPVRKLWARQIDDLISELAAAERRGELEEKLREIAERAERAAWVYEYRHFLAALSETAKQFNIQL